MIHPRLTSIFVCFCLTCALLQAQTTDNTDTHKKKVISSAYKQALRTKDLSPYEPLLWDTAFAEPIWKSHVFMSQAEALRKIHDDKFDDMDARTGVTDQDALQILDFYDKSIVTCARCALTSHVGRYEFLTKINAPKSMYQKDYQAIKAAGYKKEKTGLTFGLFGMVGGGSTWLGVETALYGGIKPAYKLRSFDPEKNKKTTIIHERPSVAMQFFVLGYARRFDGNYNEFSSSLIRLTAPVVLNATQIGWYFAPDEGDLNKAFFYRPEIGVGFGRVSVNYAYNWVFRKDARQYSPRHLFCLRVVSPIVGY